MSFIYKSFRIDDGERVDCLSTGKIITNSKGDIIVDNGSKTTALTVGTDGQVLVADSTESSGLKYKTLVASDVSDFDTEVSNNIDVDTNTTHRSLTNNPHSVTKAQVGLGDVPNLKFNLTATREPTASDDSSLGYSVGSRWLNLSTDKEYVCANDTETDAIWIETTATVADSKISFLGTSTYMTIQDSQNINTSAGWISGGSIRDGGSETINVSKGTGMIRGNNSNTGTLYFFDWPARNSLSIPTDTTRFIGVEYNSGTPQVFLKSTDVWNFNTEFPLGSVINEQGTIYILEDYHAVSDHASNIIRRWQHTKRFDKDKILGGLKLGEKEARNVTLTSGKIWSKLRYFEISAVDTSISGSFSTYHRDGVGGWVVTTGITSWPNNKYDDNSGTLQNLTGYGVNWFYLSLNGNLLMVYGQTDYGTQTDAKNSSPPVVLPERIVHQSVLLARIIYFNGASSADEIQDLLINDQTNATSISSHNKLSGLDGGTTNEYYHLTDAIYGRVKSLESPAVGENDTQTLTNKIINADFNTIRNIDNNDIRVGAGIDASKIADGSVSNTEFQYINSLRSSAVGTLDVQTLSNKSFADNTTFFQDNTDTTKKIQFELSGITTSTTRTFMFPDANTTVVGNDTDQILTNKVVDADLNTITNIDNTNIKAGASIDTTKIANGSVTNTEFQQLANIGSSVVGLNDVQTLTNKTWGDNLNMNSYRIVNVGTPVGGNDVTTKDYVDGVASGLVVKDSCRLATTVDVGTLGTDYSYANTGGSSSRGLMTWTSGPTSIDGVTLFDSDRILVKDQVNAEENGIWVRISANSWERATDFDEDTEVVSGTFTFIEEGSINDNAGFTLTTNNPITVGGASGTNLVFTQFSGAGQIFAGTGMTKMGNTLDVVGSSTIIANADSIEVNSSNISNQVLLSSGTVGLAPSYGALPLNNTNSVDGVLGFANGGTNVSSFTSGSKLITTNVSNTALETTNLTEIDIVTLSGTQILTNKTIDADSNNIKNIDDGNIKVGAGIDASKVADGSVSNIEFQRLAAITSTVVGVSDTQTLTNKTFTDNSTYFQDNADNTKKLQLELSGLSSSNTRTLAVPDANTTIVGTDVSQTLTNKTVDADSNTITNIKNADIKVGASIDATKIANGSITNLEFQYLNGVTSSVVSLNNTQTLTNKTFVDATTYFQDDVDNTKKLQFQLSGITTTTTRTLVIPDANTTIVGTNNSQTLTNKTIDSNNNTLLNIGNAQIKSSAGIDATKIANGSVTNTEFQYLNAITSDVVSINDTQILTNKTFTDSSTYFQDNGDTSKKAQFELSSIAQSTTRTYTLPDANTTLVGNNNTQILTNKTINSDNNTITNIINSNIKVGAEIDASKIANGSVSNAEFQQLASIGSTAVGISDSQTLTNKTLTNPRVQNAIDDVNGNELLKLTATVSAVNEIHILNATTTNNPKIWSSGNDANIGIDITPKGTGNIVLDGLSWPNTDGSSDQVIKTDGSGTLGFADVPILTVDTVTTTNATATTITSIPTITDTVYVVETHFAARRTDGPNEAAGFIHRSVFRNDSGTLTKIGKDHMEARDNGLMWDVDAGVSGTNINITVQGEHSKTISWKASSRITTV